MERILLKLMKYLIIVSNCKPVEVTIMTRGVGGKDCRHSYWLKCLVNYMLWIALSETDRSTLAELQYRLLIFPSDAVCHQLVSLTLCDGLGKGKEV